MQQLNGRVMSVRRMGNIAFVQLQSDGDRYQVCFRKQELGETLKEVIKSFKIGDYISVIGEVGQSSTNETTLFVSKFDLLRSTLKPFPDKWNGITDPEVRLRKRYLDIAINQETRNIFDTRIYVIRFIRDFLENRAFVEIETPILSREASGAIAKPFVTHHNAFDADFYLRIAPETYLKRAVAAGYDRVYEIGKNFRNEGTDPSHLQEFTFVEWYAAYWNYMDNLDFFRKFIVSLVEKQRFVNPDNSVSPGEIRYGETVLDFYDIKTVSYAKLFSDHLGIDIYGDLAGVEAPAKCKTKASKLDFLFKTHIRGKLIQPVFVIDYPKDLAPLASTNNTNPQVVEMFQFIVNGWEIVKAYTELTDPVEQRARLLEQAQNKADGEEESMEIDEDFIECMEYGMPPMSGLGIGIDRLVALLTNSRSIKDVVMFPMVL